MHASTQISPTDILDLSDDALVRLRALLVAEAHAEAQLSVEHAAAVSQLRDLTDADSVLERQLAEVGEARAREAAIEIRHALERIDAGTYGRCEACSLPVPFERLEAVPSARLCVRCPDRHDGWSRSPSRPRRDERATPPPRPAHRVRERLGTQSAERIERFLMCH